MPNHLAALQHVLTSDLTSDSAPAAFSHADLVRALRRALAIAIEVPVDALPMFPECSIGRAR
jgi:hypothetical protein